MKEMINTYNLGHSHLAFTVGRDLMENNELKRYFYWETTVFSEVMIEGESKDIDGDHDVQSPNGKPTSPPSLCRVFKYAPKYGFDQNEEDMVVMLTGKLEPKKYGGLTNEKHLSSSMHISSSNPNHISIQYVWQFSVNGGN